MTAPAPGAPVVVGLDLSLTSTGFALIEANGYIHVDTVRSKGSTGDSLRQRHARLHDLAARIVDQVPTVSHVAVETPAYGGTSGSHHDRSGLWWLVIDKLHQRGSRRIIEIPPTSAKKYATGKGSASKAEVLTHVIRRYSEVEFDNDNEADALVLAAMYRHLIAEPVQPVPLINMASLEKIRLDED